MKITPPLKWHGGKHYLANKIINLMPPHTHYCEPYFGGGDVLLAKDPIGVSECVNDIYGELMNFWRVLQSPTQFDWFLRRLKATPFSEAEWEESRRDWGTIDFTERAVKFFICCRQSLAGRMKQFCPLSRTRTRREMNEQCSAWLNAVEGLPFVHARMARVAILGPKDGAEVIRQQDGPQTLFYCDPPYLLETRNEKNPETSYTHEMSECEHLELLDTLSEIKGRFLLSGYHCYLYDNMAEEEGWKCHEFDLPNNAAGGEEKRRMTECLWCNFS